MFNTSWSNSWICVIETILFVTSEYIHFSFLCIYSESVAQWVELWGRMSMRWQWVWRSTHSQQSSRRVLANEQCWHENNKLCELIHHVKWLQKGEVVFVVPQSQGYFYKLYVMVHKPPILSDLMNSKPGFCHLQYETVTKLFT